MSKQIWKQERLWVTINKDKNIVKLPSGVWADWSKYGKNVDDAIDYFNDFNSFGKYSMGIGAVIGAVVTTGIVAGIHFIRKHHEKKNETEAEEA